MQNIQKEENLYFTHDKITNRKIEEITGNIICSKYNSTDKSYYNMLINCSTLEVDIYSITPIDDIKEQMKSCGFNEQEYLYKTSKMEVLSIYNTCNLLNSLSNQSVIIAYPTHGMRTTLNHISKIDAARKDEYKKLRESLNKIKLVSFVELNTTMEKAIVSYLWQNNLNYGNSNSEKTTKPRKLK